MSDQWAAACCASISSVQLWNWFIPSLLRGWPQGWVWALGHIHGCINSNPKCQNQSEMSQFEKQLFGYFSCFVQMHDCQILIHTSFSYLWNIYRWHDSEAAVWGDGDTSAPRDIPHTAERARSRLHWEQTELHSIVCCKMCGLGQSGHRNGCEVRLMRYWGADTQSLIQYSNQITHYVTHAKMQ